MIQLVFLTSNSISSANVAGEIFLGVLGGKPKL
jgi:hypothetical protein